ncbi:MAG: hypothetical protein KAZ17_01460 [Sphingorhabdus sp.]|nr:hypothetical protein [Sphingorhabdus sp.]
MFIGHFAPAFIAAAHPRAPRLGTLFIAAQLVDFAFFGLVLLNVEKMRITAGMTVMNAMDLYYMPYTHSLAGSVIFAAAMACVIFIRSKNSVGAILTAGVVLSHWFVDFLVHAPDLTLFGYAPKIGLGLWNYPMIEMPLELAMTAGAFAFYLIHMRRRNIGRLPVQSVMPSFMPAFMPVLILGAALLALQLYSWLAPQPVRYDPSIAISGLLAFGLLCWLAYRTDRNQKANRV